MGHTLHTGKTGRRSLVNYLMQIKSIRAKLIGTTLVTAILFLGLLLGVCIWTFVSYVRQEALDTSKEKLASATLELYSFAALALDQATAIADKGISLESMGRQTEITALIEGLAYNDKAEGFVMTDEQGQVFYSSYRPVSIGMDIASLPPVQSALNGERLDSVVDYRQHLVLLGIVPLIDENGQVQGTVSAIYDLESNYVVDSIQSLLYGDYTVFYGDTRISTTIRDKNGERIVGTKMEETIYNNVHNGEGYAGMAPVAGRKMFVAYAPIEDYQGNLVGVLFSGMEMANYYHALQQFAFVVLIVAVIMLSSYLLVLNKLFTAVLERPLQSLSHAAERIAMGELEVEIDIPSQDAVGQVAKSFERMLEATKVQTALVEELARGNYDITPVVRGERDTIGQSLKKLIETSVEVFQNLLGTFDNLQRQIEILDLSSENVAQNSSEQAAAIANIAHMAKELSSLAKQSAMNADQAGEYGDQLRMTATRQSVHMEELVGAVKEIDDSANGIEKIIETIDTIASQTSLLSLNASIEAARAGQHGKGFAVVATEVRDLAIRSSNAAKETRALIQNTIEKAAGGVAIAEKAKVKLDEMGGSIGQVGMLLDQITASARHQGDSIVTITANIEQVNESVSQNNARTEETAAACRMINEMAKGMEQILAQFNLPDNPASRGRERAEPTGAHSPDFAKKHRGLSVHPS